MAANIQPIKADIGDSSWGTDSIRHGLEGAGQSFKMGAPLINSSGQLIEATASNLAALSGLIGIALADATGTQGADCAYYPLTPQSYNFSITVDGAESGGNAPGTGSLAASGLYGSYNIYKDTASGYWYLEESDTTHLNVIALDFIDPAATVNGRVRIKFLRAVTAG